MAIIRVLTNLDFLAGFLSMLIQVAMTAVIGGTLGVSIGAGIIRSSQLTRATISFLRIGLWIPFLAVWALPHVLILNIITVLLLACYYYLALRFLLGMTWPDARVHVVRETLLQALFFALFSQIWLQPGGWDWFSFAGKQEDAVGYSVLICILGLLFLLRLVFRLGFDASAVLHGRLIVTGLVGKTEVPSIAAVIVAVVLGHSQSFSLHDNSSLISTAEIGFRQLTSATIETKAYELVLGDVAISLLEILGGLVLTGVFAFIVYKCLATNVTLRNWLLPVMPLTYIAPIVLSLFLMNWRILNLGWQTTTAVAFVTFFPFLRVLWGLRDLPLLCRILLAGEAALPFAFVAMLFGETISAVSGLGFYIVLTRDALQTQNAVAGALLVTVLLATLSSILRRLVRRLYFSSGAQATMP